LLLKSLVAQHGRHLHLDLHHKEVAVDAVVVVLAPGSDLRRDVLLYLADVHLFSKRIQKKRLRKRKMKRFSTMNLTRRKRRISLERKMSQRFWSPFLPRKGAAVVLGDQHLPLVLPEKPLPRDHLLLVAGSDLLQGVVVSTKTTKRTIAVPPQGLVPLLVANRMVPHAVARLPAEMVGMAVVLLVDRVL
jgi:hypothetical protein